MSKTEYNAPIHYYNRATSRIETEDVYGEGFLRWAYGNPLGRLTVALAVKRALFSRWYGWRMDQPSSRVKIEPFLATYNLATDEFAEPLESFESFNQFFYRKLTPSSRPINPALDVAVFPADGRHLVIPEVDSAKTFYLKGQSFDLAAFVGDAKLAAEFTGGSLLISRLCPVDYHRFHFPVAGQCSRSVLLPGSLRSVSPLALRRHLSILWENRRERSLIETEAFGKVLIMEIGATCVGGIHQTYTQGVVRKGDEKGYFSFGGSCVVTLFQKNAIRFDDDLLTHSKQAIEVYARMGERCGAVAAK